MAIKTKKYFSDRIILGLQDAYPNIDFNIQEREVFLVVDDIVNAMAKDNYFENWKLYGAVVDEGFVTTWDGDNAIEVIDVSDQPSYLTLPATFAALPMNGGLEVWPMNYEFGAVRLRRHEDVRRTRHLMSGGMQGELGGYPRYPLFVFDQCDVKKNYSEKFGVRGVIKDSSAIGITDPYPVPGNISEEVIKRAIMYFTEKRIKPTDVIRDKQDAITRN
jgi:hypothetical protein